MLIDNPPVELAENLFMLGTGAYPLYLFRDGGEAVLFEGSVGAVARLAAQQCAELGVDEGSLGQLVIPHAHPDHVMGVQALREAFPGITVVAGETAAGVLSNEKAVSFFCKVDQALTESLLLRGVIKEAHRVPPPSEMKIPVDRTIAAGDSVSVGTATFEAIAVTGHSDCGLSFHEVNRGILVVSDATPYYVPENGFWWPGYFTGYQPFLDAMKSLAGLKAEILCPGHNVAVKGAGDIETFFNDAIAATEAYHQRIVAEIKGGNSVRPLAEELGSEAFEKIGLMPVEFFQKNCGLLVKQSLQHEGIAE